MTDDGFNEEGEKRTLKEIADAAGVSIATVSRVLNPGSKSGAVKEETRRKVLEAAQGFAPRARNKKTLAIGVMVPTLTHPAYAELAQSLTLHLHQQGFTAIVMTPPAQHAREDAQRVTVNALLDQNVSGIIAAPAGFVGDDEAWKPLTDQPAPIIFVALEGSAPNLFIDVIRFNDRLAARAATLRLLDQGHSRIGILAGPANSPVTRERLDGISQTLTERGLLPAGASTLDLVRYCGLGRDLIEQRAREEAARALLKDKNPPTAIFALDMSLCRTAQVVIQRLKLRVPFDISLVTFSDASWMTDQISQAELTTITHAMDQLAERAVRQLLRRIESGRTPGMAREQVEINVNPEIRHHSISVKAVPFGQIQREHAAVQRTLPTTAAADASSAIDPEDGQHQAQGLLALGRLDLKLARYGTIPMQETEPGSALAQALPAKPSQYPEVESHSSLGVATWLQGNLDAAERHFQQGLTLAQDLDHRYPSLQTRELVCEFLTRLAKFAGNQGQYEEAKAQLQKGLVLAQAGDMPDARGEFLMHLGWIEGNQGDYLAAEAYLKEGLKEAQKLSEPSTADKLRSGLLLNLGWIAHCRGEFEASERLLGDGLLLARRYDLQIRICGFLENLSTVARYRGDNNAVRLRIDEGLSLRQQMEHPPRRCGLLHGKTLSLIDAGEFDEAHVHLDIGFALAVRMRYPVRICEFLLASGYLDLLQARASMNDPQQREMRLQDANDEFAAACMMATKMRHRFLISSANIWLGELHLERGTWKVALSRFNRGRMFSTDVSRKQRISVHESLEPGSLMSGQAQRVLVGWAEYGLARASAAQEGTDDNHAHVALKHGRASLAILDDIKGLQRFGGQSVADVAAWVRQHESQQESQHARA